MTERTRLYDIVRGFLKDYKKPLHKMTLGKELEIIDYPHRRYNFDSYDRTEIVPPDVTYILKYHRDYGHVYELVLPPIGFPPRPGDVLLYNAVELLAHTLGFRVAEEIVFDEVKYTCGSHLHFWNHDMKQLVKITNWVIFLGPLFVDLLSLPAVYDADRRRYQLKNVHRWRSLVRHYAEPPRYVNMLTIHDLRSGRARFRGYERHHDNQFYAVEFNAYRKRNMTVEFRLPEQHWLADVIFMDVAGALAKKFNPPIVNMERWYRDLYKKEIFEEIRIPMIKGHRYLHDRYENRVEMIKHIYEYIADDVKFKTTKQWFVDYFSGSEPFTYLYFYTQSVETFFEKDVPRYSMPPEQYFELNRRFLEVLRIYYDGLLRGKKPQPIDPYIEI